MLPPTDIFLRMALLIYIFQNLFLSLLLDLWLTNKYIPNLQFFRQLWYGILFCHKPVGVHVVVYNSLLDLQNLIQFDEINKPVNLLTKY